MPLSYIVQAGCIPAQGLKKTGGGACDLLSAVGRFVKKKSLKTGR
jgi:hypothetical protein